jgi:hypothetical protein
MNNHNFEEIPGFYSLPLKCRNCEHLECEEEDISQAFDCEPTIRGRKTFRITFYCENFPDGVEPKKCNKEES